MSASEVDAEDLTHSEAATALQKAVQFFRHEVSANGGYVWRYTADLSRREGEKAVGTSTAWVQPPGTPSVGDAYLNAYKLTGDEEFLETARECAHALVSGQLESGGWDYRIEFLPDDRREHAYRADGSNAGKRNVTTLDDNVTQSALRFLMRMDNTLSFRDAPIHDATLFGLSALLEAQYPNGAWPQRYSKFPDPANFPVLKASYPETWSRTHPKRDYRSHYTFNDNTIADVIDTMFLAADIYQNPRYRAAAEKAGGFILLAQMPEPQPAWAQQYDANMHPAWARRFEPPAVTGGESREVLQALFALYRQTGDKKYLEPVPRAMAYLKKSRLPDGRMARFYELKTNRPLFFTKEYQLTYSSDDMPTHYGFIVGWNSKPMEEEYERLISTQWQKPAPHDATATVRLTARLRAEAKSVVDAMDERGAWVERGRLKYHGNPDQKLPVIESRTFAKNVGVLSRFVAATKQ